MTLGAVGENYKGELSTPLFIYYKPSSILGVGDLKHSSIVDADWNDYGGCQVVFSSTTMGFDYAAHHRPTGNNALLICLGNNDYYFIQFHIDQNQGIYVRFKDPDHGFSNWEHLITLS